MTSAAEQLRHARTKLKLTQAGLGRELGCSGEYIGMLERGERRPGVSFANALKARFKIPTEAWDVPLPSVAGGSS